MKIVNIAAQQIEACAVFTYKGYEISASTIFKPTQVLVISDADGLDFRSAPAFNSVQEAIEWVDARISRRAKEEAQ